MSLTDESGRSLLAGHTVAELGAVGSKKERCVNSSRASERLTLFLCLSLPTCVESLALSASERRRLLQASKKSEAKSVRKGLKKSFATKKHNCVEKFQRPQVANPVAICYRQGRKRQIVKPRRAKHDGGREITVVYHIINNPAQGSNSPAIVLHRTVQLIVQHTSSHRLLPFYSG